MNDTTRQVGGALSIAIIGGTCSRRRTAPRWAMPFGASPIASGVANNAKNSLGFALQTASQIGGPAGNTLASTGRARLSSTGCTRATWSGRRSSWFAAIGALIWLPARAGRPVEAFEAEYEAGRPPAPDGPPGRDSDAGRRIRRRGRAGVRARRASGADMSDIVFDEPATDGATPGSAPLGDRRPGDQGRRRRPLRRPRLRRLQRRGRSRITPV